MRWGMFVLVGLLIALPVSASHNRFDPFVDLHSIDWFDRGIYTTSLPGQTCIDLDEYYAYADSDPYDRWDRDKIKSPSYLSRLSAADYERVAAENPYDNIDVDDLDSVGDFHCSTRREFNQFADSDPYDRYDREDFFGLYGYTSGAQYARLNRHPRTELVSSVRPYARDDGHGGVASYFRLDAPY